MTGEGYRDVLWHLLLAGVPRLAAICERLLCRYGIGVHTVAETLAMADQHGFGALRDACVEFMSDPYNYPRVRGTNGVTAIKGATIGAIFMVVVLSSMGMLAAEGTSCRERHCISECPSKCQEKADSSCETLKHGGSHGCSTNCFMGCQSSCESACKDNATLCPAGGIEGCNPVCRNTCRENCYSQKNPNYDPCMAVVFQGCKDDCEKDCKSGKV
ncbi:hypothetical protein PR202_ga30822 [Eleusine coracana subsp. coracana]|uniref:BPM/SPOP BACK domain-containing protein n=1 Tax=Eleusine coracana subsp. coracana TaxID=191504 RepID=A0AAV5DNJ5_ELECO|nr:hypothetical protein PR202_ga30822 [Eleusine coracana subsp. coracana]